MQQFGIYISVLILLKQSLVPLKLRRVNLCSKSLIAKRMGLLPRIKIYLKFIRLLQQTTVKFKSILAVLTSQDLLANTSQGLAYTRIIHGRGLGITELLVSDICIRVEPSRHTH